MSEKWTPYSHEQSLKALARYNPEPVFLHLATSGLFQPLPEPSCEDWLGGPGMKDRPGQTLMEWRRHAEKIKCLPGRKRTIYMLPLGDFPCDVDIGVLVRCVQAFYYGMKVVCLDVVPTGALRKSVKQRESRGYGIQLLTKDLYTLIERRRAQFSDAFVVMGFTMYDLYPHEDWNFVFGQAAPGKGTGVFSFARHRECEPQRFLRRCMMVLCHEIGHLFGLQHCVWWRCCMNGSNHDEESDQRPFAICPHDLAKLKEAVGVEFNLASRERALADVLESAGLPEMAAWHHRCLHELEKSRGVLVRK